jgi:site-specific DNA recombinase
MRTPSKRKTSKTHAGSSTESPYVTPPEVAQIAEDHWIEVARRSGVDLTGFDANAPLTDRIAWARAARLDVGGVLSRYSSKMQHSTNSQVQECVAFAATHGIYVPPEFICVDEATSGRKSRRKGLDRMKEILAEKQVDVLLVFKVSRLFRSAYKGFAFFAEEVVEQGLRGISVSQGIDTRNGHTWKSLMALHGIMDELLLTTIADHVRAGLKSLFAQGYVTGALTVGYRRIVVPGAPLTNRGLPRTMPQIIVEVATLIHQHYEWIRDGMAIREGWRRWLKAGGPCDPRSTLGHMSYHAYRRMLSNIRYTGKWAFGRKRNTWSSKRDYTRQALQPDTEVGFFQCEELRIIDDQLFADVQKRLAALKLGPRGPKKRRDVQLWDLVTETFFCAQCGVRFYQSGANGGSMACKRGALCPCPVSLNRRTAVRLVCDRLARLIESDVELIEQVTTESQRIDTCGEDSLRAELGNLERKISVLDSKIDDLSDIAGQGTPEYRARHKAKILVAQRERADLVAEKVRLTRALHAPATAISPETVRAALADLRGLLADGAAGSLGDDVVYRAAAVFRQLIGERILVHVERRARRKRCNVRGVFRPALLRTVKLALGDDRSNETADALEVDVWLRQPPKRDLFAKRVHEMVDVDKLSYRDAAKILQSEGHRMNSGVVWQIRRRYFEMTSMPVPPITYNNGHIRSTSR